MDATVDLLALLARVVAKCPFLAQRHQLDRGVGDAELDEKLLDRQRAARKCVSRTISAPAPAASSSRTSVSAGDSRLAKRATIFSFASAVESFRWRHPRRSFGFWAAASYQDLATLDRVSFSGYAMESDFRTRAKDVWRKYTQGSQGGWGGGSFHAWSDAERETWRQINEMDAIEWEDLRSEEYEDGVCERCVQQFGLQPEEDILRLDPEYQRRKAESRERFRRSIEQVRGMSESDQREAGLEPGSSLEERFRWVMRRWLPPTSS